VNVEAEIILLFRLLVFELDGYSRLERDIERHPLGLERQADFLFQFDFADCKHEHERHRNVERLARIFDGSRNVLDAHVLIA
jgi:hypothetical protein